MLHLKFSSGNIILVFFLKIINYENTLTWIQSFVWALHLSAPLLRAGSHYIKTHCIPISECEQWLNTRCMNQCSRCSSAWLLFSRSWPSLNIWSCFTARVLLCRETEIIRRSCCVWNKHVSVNGEAPILSADNKTHLIPSLISVYST